MKELIHRIPGAWYGNSPGFIEACPKRGNVVVAPSKLDPALRWLHRRGRILKTAISADINPGIIIDFELR